MARPQSSHSSIGWLVIEEESSDRKVIARPRNDLTQFIARETTPSPEAQLAASELMKLIRTLAESIEGEATGASFYRRQRTLSRKQERLSMTWRNVEKIRNWAVQIREGFNRTEKAEAAMHESAEQMSEEDVLSAIKNYEERQDKRWKDLYIHE